MKSLITLVLSVFIFQSMAYSQGCVAIRGMSSCDGSSGSFALRKGEFMTTGSYRYFKSFRHFRGDHEETERIEKGTNVINKSHFVDLGLSYGITKRLYGSIVIPYVNHNRSSMYEHGGNPPRGKGERHVTESQGLGDIRLSLGYWFFEPMPGRQFNVSGALGVKLPTGSYDAKDEFYNQGPLDNETVTTVVDQSIQPGDGGVGITAESQAYMLIGDSSVMLLASGFYMSNPAVTNGVKTRRGTSEFSCPDQFAVRAGAFVSPGIKNTFLYAGGRVEGVRAFDLIGSSQGYRRPGYAVSVEPGLSYFNHNFGVNVSVPIALYRNRIQSYSDIQRTEQTGVYRHGDAAFADYLLNLGVFYRFGG